MMNTVKKAPVKKLSKQSNKGLQRFTDFEVIKTKEAMLKLKEEEPEEYKKLGSWITEKLNDGITRKNTEAGAVDKYYSRMELYYSIDKPDKPEGIENMRRIRWQVNKSLIETAIHNSIITYNRLPIQSEIAEVTGLSRVTISKHLKEGVSSENYREEIEGYKLMTPKVLNLLYKMAIEQNDLKAMKTFLDYFKDSSSSSSTTIKQQNNYLQINNTRIDKVTVKELPEGARLQIENIIKLYQTV